jgi:hypothetical protein
MVPQHLLHVVGANDRPQALPSRGDATWRAAQPQHSRSRSFDSDHDDRASGDEDGESSSRPRVSNSGGRGDGPGNTTSGSGAGPGNGNNASASETRQRAAQACLPCRRRKVRCSGGWPCRRCDTTGLTCDYGPGGRGGVGAGGAGEEGQGSEMSARLMQLEATVSNLVGVIAAQQQQQRDGPRRESIDVERGMRIDAQPSHLYRNADGGAGSQRMALEQERGIMDPHPPHAPFALDVLGPPTTSTTGSLGAGLGPSHVIDPQSHQAMSDWHPDPGTRASGPSVGSSFPSASSPYAQPFRPRVPAPASSAVRFDSPITHTLISPIYHDSVSTSASGMTGLVGREHDHDHERDHESEHDGQGDDREARMTGRARRRSVAGKRDKTERAQERLALATEGAFEAPFRALTYQVGSHSHSALLSSCVLPRDWRHCWYSCPARGMAQPRTLSPCLSRTARPRSQSGTAPRGDPRS